MKSFAPFLKMYTDYVKNFDRANSLVETWLDKSPTLKSKIQQICDKVRQISCVCSKTKKK